MRFLAVALLCGVALTTSANGQQGSDAPLTNASVVKLVERVLKRRLLLRSFTLVQNFNLGTDQLVQLKHDGVSENIIMAMMSQDGSFIGSGDDWGDESFFKNKKQVK